MAGGATARQSLQLGHAVSRVTLAIKFGYLGYLGRFRRLLLGT